MAMIRREMEWVDNHCYINRGRNEFDVEENETKFIKSLL